MAYLYTLTSSTAVYVGIAAALALAATALALRKRAAERKLKRGRIGELRNRFSVLSADSSWRLVRQHMAHWQAIPWSYEALSATQRRGYLRLARAIERLALDEGCVLSLGMAELNVPHSTDVTRAVESYRGGLFDPIPTLAKADHSEFLGCLFRALTDALETEGRALVTDEPTGAYEELDPGQHPPLSLAEWTPWYERVCSRVSREDELVHQRLTWMMQFEAFLFTAFGLIVSRGSPTNESVLSYAIETLIPCIGWFGAFASSRGVSGAHAELNALKSAYLASLDRYKLSHVRPFGAHAQHSDGLFISATFPRAMMLTWAIILLIVVFLGLRA